MVQWQSYNCSYQQIRNWVKKYEDMGSAGVETDVVAVLVHRQAVVQKKSNGIGLQIWKE